jgi:hypothetical protein
VIRFLLSVLVWFLRAVLRSRGAVVLENLALRQQLATYCRGHKRPQVKPEERLLWAVLWKVWPGWRSAWLMVKPATVIGWHRRLSRGYWRWRSRKPGRPAIPNDHIALIRRISTDHPEWGEDKIAEELAVKLGVRHSTSTIPEVQGPETRAQRRSDLENVHRESRQADLRGRLPHTNHGILHGRVYLRGHGDRIASHRAHQRHEQP